VSVDPLAWSPPEGWESYPTYTISEDDAADTSASVLRLTLDDASDWRIVCAHTVRRAVEVRGGRNVVWVGRRTHPHRP